MKINSIKTILFLLATVFAYSCDKDESDFTGKDCYISSFRLKQGDITLSAAISSGNIVITAPEKLSLSGAAATISLSENASIDPRPADIVDWDAEQTFTVTSYNGIKSTYRYHVERNVISKEGDVVLLTQADVETLAALEPTLINGSLTVGAATGKDSIYTLAPLASLKTVTYDLIINATYAGENLAGLENLEKVGSLQIVQAKKLKMADLPKLSAVMSDFIVNQSFIKTLTCPGLVKIDKGLQVLNADSLVVMDFGKLQSIIENMTIQGGYSVNKLQAIHFPVLAKVGGNINVTNWKEVKEVNMPLLSNTVAVSVTGLPKMESLEMSQLKSTLGGINISGNQALADMNLSSLQSIGGDCRISNIPVENMNGLKSLTSVGGELFISDMAKLTNIQGLKALSTVSGRLYLSNWPILEDETLNGFSSLSSVGGELTISQIPFKKFNGFALVRVTNMGIYGNGISSIEEIDVRDIEIENTLTLSNITTPFVLKGKDVCTNSLNVSGCRLDLVGFKEIKNFTYSLSVNLQSKQTVLVEKVTGDFSVSIYNFDEFSMPNLEEIGGKFTLSATNGIKTILFPSLKKVGESVLDVAILQAFSLPALQTVDGNFAITTGRYQADVLSDIQMPSLITVNGVLNLTGYSSNYFNSKLLCLDGFRSLQSVKGVTVSYNKGLVDYSGLENALSSCPEAEWKVSNNAYNPSYQDMKDGKFIKPSADE